MKPVSILMSLMLIFPLLADLPAGAKEGKTFSEEELGQMLGLMAALCILFFMGVKDDMIGYFSLEFGLHESLPLYSGGLGILAGDHVAASGTAGLDRYFVSGKSRVPRPPPSTRTTTLRMIPAMRG